MTPHLRLPITGDHKKQWPVKRLPLMTVRIDFKHRSRSQAEYWQSPIGWKHTRISPIFRHKGPQGH